MRAVIFDLDNTLIRSYTDFVKMKKKIIEYLQDTGIEGDILKPERTTVEMVIEAVRQLEEKGETNYGISTVLRGVNDIMNKVELENVKMTHPLDSAADLLRTLKAIGVKIGVLTRGCEAYAREALRVTGLLGYIDSISARTDLLQAKPNPEALYSLCRDLEVTRSEIAFVGDHPIDATCARLADVEFVGILEGPANEEAMRQAGSQINMRNLIDVKEFLLRKLNSL